MVTPASPDPALPRSAPAAHSDRMRLAQLARDAALEVHGVADATAGPAGIWRTVGAEHQVAGVTAAAIGEDRYGLTLHLVGELVPLREVAERVRERVERAASAAGLRSALGPVHVSFEDVVEAAGRPGEPR